MKPKLSCLVLAFVIALALSGCALAEAASVAETAAPQPTATPAAPAESSATPEPEATPVATEAPVPTQLPAEEARRKLEQAELSLDSLSIELELGRAQRVLVTELDVLELAEDAQTDWYVSSYTGDAASVELEPIEGGRGVYVYARADAPGQSEFEITCRCALDGESCELTALLALTVREAAEEVPARIEGIELIYRAGVGDNVTIAPDNLADFPQGTQWTLTARKTGLDVSGSGGTFEVSAQRAGRYVALLNAQTPAGASRMAYIVFEIGDSAADRELALNYERLDITLDMSGATNDATFFIQPADALAYLPAVWTLKPVDANGAARLEIEPLVSGAVLNALPLSEGMDQYSLSCSIPSLGRSVTIPVTVRVRDSADAVSGIALKRAQYSMSLDEAITLSPYLLPQGATCPEGTLWTAYQIDAGADQLALSVNEANGQTTVLAYRPGVYTIEFAAQISANRIYTATVELTVTR